MTEITQNKDETRKDYLIRVVIKMLTESAHNIDPIFYDGEVCNAPCLVHDLKAEFKTNQ